MAASMCDSKYQSIAEFYAGKTIFITGGSGFVGKVLIEKLLRSCPDVRRIYMLMRSKRGVAVEDRISKLFESHLFENVRAANPNVMEKVHAVTGDMILPELGLSAQDQASIHQEVNVVFHSAATIRFDEKLKLAIEMNVEGCQKILNLVQKIENLDALVHVSTAYCNCDRKKIDEVVYTPQLLPQKLLDALEWMDEDILDKLTPKLIGKKPNTYTYTKALAEYLLASNAENLPLTIVRPSIIGATWVEPTPGWVDNFNGPTGMFAAVGTGFLRTMIGDTEAVADLVPVDTVANLLLTAGWHVAIHKPKNIPVFNCTSGQINQLRWGQMEKLSYEQLMKNPLENVIRLPSPKLTKSHTVHSLKYFFDQQVPCFLLDMWMYVTGNKAIFRNVNNKINRSVSSLEYFTSNGWEFSNSNTLSLLTKMSPADKQDFNFDIRKLNWKDYVEKYCLGMKKYTLKEDVNNMGKARRRIKNLQRMSFVFNTVLAIIVWRLAVRRVKVVHTMWYIMMNLVSSIFQKVPKIARA